MSMNDLTSLTRTYPEPLHFLKCGSNPNSAGLRGVQATNPEEVGSQLPAPSKDPGQTGALLRREELYSSNLTN